MSTPYSVIGKRVVRKDAVQLVTGSAKYAIDVSLPGMLYGRILRSPYAHAKITAIDASKALALPGVEAVITYNDVPQKFLTTSQAPSATTGVYSVTDTLTLESEAKYVGDEIAAVAATDPFIAEDALDLIQVTYQQLPFVLTPDAALASGAPPVHSNMTSNLIAAYTGSKTGGIGSAATAMAAANNTFQTNATTPRQIVAALGPLCAVFDWPPGGDLTVYDSNQGTYGTRGNIADVFGTNENQINIIDQQMGGGFGMTNAYRYHPIGALLARKTGKPVKLDTGKIYSFAGSSKQRHPVELSTTLGINNDGTLQAIEIASTWDKGAYTTGGFTGAGGTPATGTEVHYMVPATYTYQTAYTNNTPCGAFRGWGVPQVTLALETAVNNAAEKLGIDPVQIRTKCIVTNGYGNQSAIGVGTCLSEAASAFGWNWTPFKSKASTGAQKAGVGCAIALNVGGGATAGTINSDSATIMMNVDGTATLLTSIVEIGTGTVTALAMIAAEELKMSIAHVGVQWGNSFLPEAPIQQGTRTVHFMGRAVQAAADQVMPQLFALAAPMLNTTPDQLSAANETIYVTSSPTQSVTYAQVMLKAPRSLLGSAVRPNPSATIISWPWSAVFVNVTVDTQTGEVGVNNMVAADDIGRVINLATAENQTHGGTIMSLGYSLSEEYVVDNQTGTVLTDDYLDYGLYSIANTPPLDVIFVESNDLSGPFGAKGLGELPCNAVPAAIASAIYNAAGVWVNLPFTPAKVLQALGKV